MTEQTTGIAQLDDASFMEGTTGGYTFVDFWAGWCAPCRRLAPSFEKAADDHTSERVRFAKVDVEEATETAELLQIQTIPTVVLFDPEGNEVGRVVNPPPGSFDAMVRDVMKDRGL